MTVSSVSRYLSSELPLLLYTVVAQHFDGGETTPFVMATDADASVKAKYTSYKANGQHYPNGDQLRGQARVGRGKLYDLTVAWLKRLLGAQRDLATPTNLSEWVATKGYGEQSTRAVNTRAYPTRQWLDTRCGQCGQCGQCSGQCGQSDCSLA